jgi:hypothetical protein
VIDSCDDEYDSFVSVNDCKLLIAPLKYIDVVIDGKHCRVLVDSGSLVPLIHSSLVSNQSFVGTVDIQPVVGAAVTAK